MHAPKSCCKFGLSCDYPILWIPHFSFLLLYHFSYLFLETLSSQKWQAVEADYPAIPHKLLPILKYWHEFPEEVYQLQLLPKLESSAYVIWTYVFYINIGR